MRPNSPTEAASPITRTLCSNSEVCSTPPGSSECWVWIALTTSSTVTCRSRIFSRLSQTRRFGSVKPISETSPAPGRVWKRSTRRSRT